MTITKRNDGNYLVDTGELLADLREWKVVCRLEGNTLRTLYEKGFIVCVPPVRVNLGPVSLSLVQALRTGEFVELGGAR